jgi:hypothetical protein
LNSCRRYTAQGPDKILPQPFLACLHFLSSSLQPSQAM